MGDMIALPGKSLLKELCTTFKSLKAPVISLSQIEPKEADKYGIIKPGKTVDKNYYEVLSIVEKPKISEAPSTFAMTGKYILSKEIFPYLKILLDKAVEKEEVRLSVALNMYAQEHKLFGVKCIHQYYDSGNKIDLFKTEIVFSSSYYELGEKVSAFLKNFKK